MRSPGLLDGPNAFAFVGNRPLMFIDPSGLWKQWVMDGLRGTSEDLAYAAGFALDASSDFIQGTGDALLRLPGLPQAAPMHGHNIAFQLGQVTGSSVGLAVDVAGIIGGGTMGTGGALATVGSGGLAAPVSVPAAAVGATLATAGVAGLGMHGPRLGEGVQNLMAESLGDKPMFGSGGTQMTSKTVWKGDKGMRIDVENPNPGQRPGQIHFQQGAAKYLYDPAAQTFVGAPRWVNELLKGPAVQGAIDKALRFLGEAQ